MSLLLSGREARLLANSVWPQWTDKIARELGPTNWSRKHSRWCSWVTLVSEAWDVVEKKQSPRGIPNKILDGAPQGARRF